MALSGRKASLGQAFHLFNPATLSISELVAAVNATGYPVRLMAYDTWIDEFERFSEGTTDNALAPLASLFPKTDQDGQHSKMPKRAFDRSNAVTALAGTSISCPPADDMLISTYIANLVQSGFLPAPQTIATS